MSDAPLPAQPWLHDLLCRGVLQPHFEDPTLEDVEYREDSYLTLRRTDGSDERVSST